MYSTEIYILSQAENKFVIIIIYMVGKAFFHFHILIIIFLFFASPTSTDIRVNG
jgi:hypothetical protein